MIWTISAISAVFLGPLAIAYIWNTIQIHRLEEEERKLRLIDKLEKKYGVTISEEDLNLN